MSVALPCIAISCGEPAGIGPDLCVALAQQSFDAQLVVIGDPQLLHERSRLLAQPLRTCHWRSGEVGRAHQPGELQVLPVQLEAPVQAGKLNRANAAYVLQCLKTAVQGCQAGWFDALVTGPVHKGVINEAGIAFTGHTEYLAQATQTPLPVMLLQTEGLRVALATTHLPLNAVSKAITRPLLKEIIEILHRDLRSKFGSADPRIYVCGLNPHAGEDGHLGREEIEVITPVLEELRAKGLRLTGPLAADTIFSPENIANADAFLAMFHDQGLPVLKYAGFGKAVNITLGLPLVRTSVDHGTALSLAGSGRADCGSFILAIKTAQQMALSKVRSCD